MLLGLMAEEEDHAFEHEGGEPIVFELTAKV